MATIKDFYTQAEEFIVGATSSEEVNKAFLILLDIYTSKEAAELPEKEFTDKFFADLKLLIKLCDEVHLELSENTIPRTEYCLSHIGNIGAVVAGLEKMINDNELLTKSLLEYKDMYTILDRTIVVNGDESKTLIGYSNIDSTRLNEHGNAYDLISLDHIDIDNINKTCVSYLGMKALNNVAELATTINLEYVEMKNMHENLLKNKDIPVYAIYMVTDMESDHVMAVSKFRASVVNETGKLNTTVAIDKLISIV